MAELSPTAQAVFDATFPVYDDEILYVAPARKHASMIAAAALRAAAKCLEELPESSDYSFWCSSHVAGIDRGVEKLFAIADELEANYSTSLL